MTTPAPEPGKTPNLFKFLVPLAAILVLITGALYVVKSQFGRPQIHTEEGVSVAMNVGSVLPDFSLHELGPDGKPGRVIAASALPSKVTLVNFWATWCEACMVEMPSLIQLREAYQAKGFDLAEVNVDQNPETVLPPVIKRLGIRFPIYFDPDQALADLFQISAIPLTLVIDKNRRILMIENGERDWNSSEVRALIEKWLAG